MSIEEGQKLHYFIRRFRTTHYFIRGYRTTSYFIRGCRTTRYFIRGCRTTCYFIRRFIMTHYFIRRFIMTHYFIRGCRTTHYFIRRLRTARYFIRDSWSALLKCSFVQYKPSSMLHAFTNTCWQSNEIVTITSNVPANFTSLCLFSCSVFWYESGDLVSQGLRSWLFGMFAVLMMCGC